MYIRPAKKISVSGSYVTDIEHEGELSEEEPWDPKVAHDLLPMNMAQI